MRILLNASNVAAMGPAVLLREMVPSIAAINPEDEFLLLAPTTLDTSQWRLPGNVSLQRIPRGSPAEVSRMWDLYVRLPRIAQSSRFDAFVTLGDLGPIALATPHFIYLHQPYYVYHVAELTNVLSPFERIKLSYQRRHFTLAARKAQTVIVQTPVMANRTEAACKLPAAKVAVVRPPLPFDLAEFSRIAGGSALPLPAQGKFALLFLAAYYPHKNHAIVLKVAEELRARKLDKHIHIFLTIDNKRQAPPSALMQALETYSDVVTNLGSLSHVAAIQAFKSADALFLPSLVETLGIPYLEALALQRPILTSDRDFAHYICGDNACYFDPHDASSIVDKIEELTAGYSGWQQRLAVHAPEQLARVSQSASAMAEEFSTHIREAILSK